MTGLVLLSGCQALHSETRLQYVSRLHRDIFKNYDKDIIPVIGEGEPVNLKMGMSMYHMKLNENAELDFTAWARFSWTDARLKWDPEEYHNITDFRIPANRVWVPDAEIYNAIEYGPGYWSNTLGEHHHNAIVYNNGMVLYIPPIHGKVQCKDAEEPVVDMPWGEYDCLVKLGSWTFDSSKLNISKYGDLNCVDINDLDPLSPLFVTENSCKEESLESKVYDCCPETYQSIAFKFKVQRRFISEETGIKNNEHILPPLVQTTVIY